MSCDFVSCCFRINVPTEKYRTIGNWVGAFVAALILHYILLILGIPSDLLLVVVATGKVVQWALNSNADDDGRNNDNAFIQGEGGVENGSSSTMMTPPTNQNAGGSTSTESGVLQVDPYDTTTSPLSQQQQQQDQNDNNSPMTTPILPRPSAQRLRYYFLDNLKIFLTALVLTHHVSCAFGACGSAGWYLGVGDDDNEAVTAFSEVLKIFTFMNQGYFMTLFFLISGFFTASSYDRKGKSPAMFLQDKVKRLLVPAVVCSYTTNPLALLISQWSRDQSLFYFPHAGACWYLYWLYIFCFAYTTLADEKAVASAANGQDNVIVEEQGVVRDDDFNRQQSSATLSSTVEEHVTAAADVSSNQSFQFPSTKTRIVKYGLLFCGFYMLIVAVLTGVHTFYGMPIFIGSFVNDIVMFTAGITAKRYGVFDRNIAEQLDVSLICFRSIVAIEIAAMIFVGILLMWSPIWYLVLGLVAGPYCVDMNLALLQIFQVTADSVSSLSRKLAKAAYTVYLIHPLIIVCVTAVYIEAYNTLDGIQIEFDDDSPVSPTTIGNGDMAMGW
eukprot:CAMPEP_0116032504 /NCGR_PEP_ID=MMETSP0321-20121206/18212_1 /TAXON_ID=163516 /ORGANISM="Leptocylindrus danicus var. danicus, Strain B650" /LENGTH=555 /DNA_ID=CAMNT_0003507959 /DNA_START=65 /DNA_END=1729 /DNA_ORIENTATION=-